jgi:alkylated DNA repair dioxygenase AlkB
MQLCLLDTDVPGFDPRFRGIERFDLGGRSFVDFCPGWVSGHGRTFEELRGGLQWSHGDRLMYDRRVAVPRLTVQVPPGQPSGFPMVDGLSRALSGYYGECLDSVSMSLYRDGRDSVAWHADNVRREEDDAVVALVVLGEPRPFVMRPLGGGPTLVFKPGWGDLLVMGGECQQTHEHCVPKVRHAGPRMSVMFRNRDTW